MKSVAALLRILLGLAVSSAAAAGPSIQIDIGNGVTLDLILVQPGQYSQGSPEDEAGRGADEAARPVSLTKPFYLGRTEVTRRQFETFVRATGYRTEAEDGKSGGYGWDGQKLLQRKDFNWRSPGIAQTGEHPVCCVTWFDAQRFCEWLSQRSGRKFSLPSEAQWEYACRAGTQTPWPLEVDETAWHKGNSGFSTHAAAGLKANAWGFHDMGGNVWEWCEDWYAPYPAGRAIDPLQTNDKLSDKPRRVLRGGGFLKDASGARSAARFRNDPRSRNADNGFRVMTFTLVPVLPKTPVEATHSASNAVEQPAADSSPAQPAPSPVAPVSAPPARTADVPRTGGSSTLLWVILSGLGLLVFAVIRKLRGVTRGAITTTEPPAAPSRGDELVRFDPTADGFWLRARAERGSRIRWSCQAGGTPLEGVLEYEPGPRGQFVFTGQPPENIAAVIVGMAAALGMEPERQSPFPPPHSQQPPQREEPSPPARRSQPRYPSAY